MITVSVKVDDENSGYVEVEQNDTQEVVVEKLMALAVALGLKVEFKIAQ